MSPENNPNELLQIEVPGTDAFEEEDTPTRDADLLNGLRVASPCDASWGQMEGDDLVRFCRHCQKNVYNLSGMSRREAAAFVRESQGRLCVRFYRRADGTLLTDNCPVGWRAARRWLLARMATVVGLLGAASFPSLFEHLLPTPRFAMGRLSCPPPPALEGAPAHPPVVEMGNPAVLMGRVVAPRLGDPRLRKALFRLREAASRRRHRHRRWRHGRRR